MAGNTYLHKEKIAHRFFQWKNRSGNSKVFLHFIHSTDPPERSVPESSKGSFEYSLGLWRGFDDSRGKTLNRECATRFTGHPSNTIIYSPRKKSSQLISLFWFIVAMHECNKGPQPAVGYLLNVVHCLRSEKFRSLHMCKLYVLIQFKAYYSYITFNSMIHCFEIQSIGNTYW